jgi:hypothetical protein
MERPLGCVLFGTIKGKNTGLRPIWHNERKVHWAVSPLAQK